MLPTAPAVNEFWLNDVGNSVVATVTPVAFWRPAAGVKFCEPEAQLPPLPVIIPAVVVSCDWKPTM